MKEKMAQKMIGFYFQKWNLILRFPNRIKSFTNNSVFQIVLILSEKRIF